MRKLWIVCGIALLTACATQHGTRVSCDSKLRPINAPATQVAAPLAGTEPVKAMNGAP